MPFAREYGGLLDNRSFGGVQVSRTFYARGQTGQQLLLGAYQALERQVAAGTVTTHRRHEMLELVVVDGRARGIIARDMVTGAIETHLADVVVLATGGYGNVFYLSTNAMGSNVTATWRAHRKGAFFGNPCYTQIHPTCIPVSGDYQSKLTLMSESLRNDGRIWVPKKKGDTRDPRQIPEDERDYYLERKYPAFGNLVPRDIASRAAKQVCDEGYGVGPKVEGVSRGVYLDFAEAIQRMGRAAVVREVRQPLRHVRAHHRGQPLRGPDAHLPGRALHDGRAVGGLRPAVHHPRPVRGRRGELLRPRRQPPGRLGAHAGPVGRLLRAAEHHQRLPGGRALREDPLRPPGGGRGREVGAQAHRLLPHEQRHAARWTPSTRSSATSCGSTAAWSAARRASRPPSSASGSCATEFWRDVKVLGTNEELNQALERAGRVADFLELGELMCIDALHRRESCGGHFRAESQTEDGEALRHDDEFAYVAAWEWAGAEQAPVLHKEALVYENIELKQRSYK